MRNRSKYLLFTCLLVLLIPASGFRSFTIAETIPVTGTAHHYFAIQPPLIFNSGDPLVTCDSPSATLSFRRADNLILIKAKADSTEGYFILDTGAPYLILNMTYFRDYRSTAEMNGREGGITGEVSSLAPTQVGHFVIGPFHYRWLDADRINLGHIEDSKGVKILGLLGMQLFKKFEMIIDYQRSEIHLHLIGRRESKYYQHRMLQNPQEYHTLPFLLQRDKIMVKATFGTKTLTFIIDTGAESNVIDSRLPNSVLEAINVTRRVKLVGNGSAKIDALYGDINDLKIGGTALGTLPVLVTNLEKMCSAYDVNCLDGMLGFDFLSMHKIGFNFVTRKMYIWK